MPRRKNKVTRAKRKYTRRTVREIIDMPSDSIAEAAKDKIKLAGFINQAKTPAERQLRKAAMHGMMYGAGPETLGKYTMDPRKEVEAAIPGPPDTNPKTLMGNQKVPILSVVPPASIIAQATAMRCGAYLAPRIDGKRGYGPYNWRDQPIEAHIYVDAAMRHIMQWFDGDEFELIRDDEGRVIDEVNHLSFALATLGILIDAKVNGTLIDDRPRNRQMSASNMLNEHKLPRYDK